MKVVKSFQALYLDRCKDDTKVRSAYCSLKIIKAEHVSLLQEPSTIYVVHLTIEISSARVISDAFIFFNQIN